MSLLMDALKKAELAKRKAQPDSTSSSASTSAPGSPPVRTDSAADEPASTLSFHSGDARLPNLPEHLELLDHEFDTEPQKNVAPAEKPPRHTSAESLTLQADEQPLSKKEPVIPPATAPVDSERESVQNLFGTKQTAPSRKLFGIAVGVASLFAIAAIGLYFWMELQPKSGLQAMRPIANTVTASRPASIAPPAPMASSSADALPPQPVVPAMTGLPLFNSPVAEKEEYVSEDAAPVAPVRPNKKLFQVSNAVAPTSNQALDRAYAALGRDDYATAKAAYSQVLSTDPKNADALAGMAVVAQRSGNDEAAADFYLQMLDADPKNSIALAGLMNLQSRMDPSVAETRLKQALASQPDSAALNFSLGNIYSRSKRWNDAQQAYFKAVAGDPGNPDYLFNLAVSLDQIRQPKLAEKYYGQAIAAAQSRPAGFDKARVNERLLKLQQQP